MESRQHEYEATELLQTANDEHEEMDQLRKVINCGITRLVLVPLDGISATNIIELQVALDRYNELKRKYRGS